MKIPCIKKKGLDLFSTTADERLILGEDIFLRTHYPTSFRRYRGESLTEVWTENQILDLLQSTEQNVKGNRVFVLFGASGSGKSECIRWLESTLNSNENNKIVVRISRTELDPLKIIQKLLLLVDQSLSKDILIRWEVLKNKPVTLANSIVWNSLSLLLDTDEDIIPLSYKLRPLIENNLRKSFSDLVQKEQLKEKVIELITVEELEELIKSCAIPITINYEQLRKHLVEKLETEVLGGYSFINTLREVGKYLYSKTGSRPILLIDDLVQSMNIYSSDLLDFFITSEEGNWDIVIGLTPAYFETTKRGRKLLTRINYLDTFDDRLYKLWLTDEYGNESYTINIKNSSDYIRNYLIEYKRSNGYICDKLCPNYSKCIALQWGNEDDLNLTPLNKYLANRIFENLFKTKGQARHFVVTVCEYLNAIINNNTVEFLSSRINRECSIDIDDYEKKIYIESFIPIDTTGDMEVPGEFLRVCGCKRAGKVAVGIINLRNKIKDNNVLDQVKETIDKPEIAVLRDWIEDKQVNKELFKNFRVCCSTFLREFSKKLDLIRQYTSRNFGAIKREKTVEGCKIPIRIEDVDKFEGISISKLLGHNIFKFMQIKEVSGDAQEKLLNELLCKTSVIDIINQTNKLGEEFIKTFERQIDICCSELVFLLYIFAYSRTNIKDVPMIINRKFKKLSLNEFPGAWNDRLEDLTEIELKFIQEFFNDWFQLRDNFYDGYQLNKMILKYCDVIKVLKTLNKLKVDDLSKDYFYGNCIVRDLLESILNKASKCYKVLSNNSFRQYCDSIINKINSIINTPADQFYKMQIHIHLINMNYKNICSNISLPELSCEDNCNEFKNITEQVKNGYPECITDLSHAEKSDIYCYFENLSVIYTQILKEYSFLWDSFINNVKEYRIKNKNSRKNTFELNMYIQDNINLYKIPSLIEQWLLKSQNLREKLDYMEYIKKYIGIDFVNNLQYFRVLISKLKLLLTKEEILRLRLDIYSDIINKFLQQTYDVLYGNELTKIDDSLNGAIFQLVSTKALDQISQSVYELLLNKVETQMILSKISKDDETYNNHLKVHESLKRIKCNSFHYEREDISFILKNIGDKKYHSENVYGVLSSNGFSYTASKVISQVIVEGEYNSALSLLDLNVLKELNDQSPDLASKIKCNLTYN